jgi:hypothetical protein
MREEPLLEEGKAYIRSRQWILSDSNYTDSVIGELLLHAIHFPAVVPQASHTCLETLFHSQFLKA